MDFLFKPLNSILHSPSLLQRLHEVTRLDLSHNPMTYLGEESVSMAKLTHLYLNHMSLQDLSDQALSGAPLLSHMDLSHNQLRYLDPLVGPKNLNSLNLTGTVGTTDRYNDINDTGTSHLYYTAITVLFQATHSTVTATYVP